MPIPPPGNPYSVDFTELSFKEGPPGKSPLEHYRIDGSFHAVRVLKCLWHDRLTLIEEIACPPIGPEVYPHNRSTGAIALAASVVGIPKSGPLGGGTYVPGTMVPIPTSNEIEYEYAEITISYGFLNIYFTGSNFFILEQIRPWSTSIPVPTGKLVWDANDGERVRLGGAGDQSFYKDIMGTEYEVTFYNINLVPPSALLLQGCCNQYMVGSLTLGLTFAKEYLLYKHFLMGRTISMGGRPTWKLSYTFVWRPIPWNKQWNVRADPSAWQNIYIDDGSQVIFHELADLMLLYPV